MGEPLLVVQDLHTEFRTAGRIVRAVNGASFVVNRGETVGIVGESGSGKSVTALSVMGLIPSPPGFITAGSVRFDGEELIGESESRLSNLRGSRMAMVFQDPFTSLNPTMTIGRQVAEPILLHKRISRAAARSEAIELLRSVRIPAPEIRYNQYPHQISGGQRQRVMIAIAFACNPGLLIADEPTTALDVTVQAQILALMEEMRVRSDTGVLIITHDLGVIAESCSRVLVMYAGKIVKSGAGEQVLKTPLHPYTQGLLASLPGSGPVSNHRLHTISGQPPDLSQMTAGCPFLPRCEHAIPDVCAVDEPPLIEPLPDHGARCFLYGEQRMQSSQAASADR